MIFHFHRLDPMSEHRHLHTAHVEAYKASLVRRLGFNWWYRPGCSFYVAHGVFGWL